ncbi:MAG: hypothetical protein KDG52_08140 [Rhodocyclaceae bacterium]|nr:hypothetical protein [Rhodocyclaceae bacterium]
MTTFRRIHRDDIEAHLKAGTPMHLVEALPPRHYAQGHLPGAIRLDHDDVRTLAESRLPAKDALIVVYCASAACQNSRLTARTLAAMGYTRVAEYEEGKQDWIEAGLPLERASVAS